MRQVVRDIFFDFTVQREGFTPFMYCDTLNLVTTGVGNLIDNSGRNTFDTSDAAMAPAMPLPWKFKGVGWTPKNPIAADMATKADIKEAWIRTKLRQRDDSQFISKGGIRQGGFSYSGFTPLTLDMDGIKTLFSSVENHFDKTLASRFAGYESYPADAQLALLSMSWAMGPGFNFPAFKLAIEKQDFVSAANQSFFKGGGGTIDDRKGRNAENFLMFNNAAVVVKGGGGADRLYFPGTPSNSSGQLSSEGIANISGKTPATEIALISAGVAGAAFAAWKLFKHWKGK